MNALPLVLAALMFFQGPAGRAGPVTGGHCFPAAPSALAPAPPVVASSGRDPWLGEDKARHLFMSFAVTTMTFGFGRAAGMEARVAMPVAAGATLAAGIGKEIHDGRSGRFFSIRDFAFDLLGLGLGLMLASHTR